MNNIQAIFAIGAIAMSSTAFSANSIQEKIAQDQANFVAENVNEIQISYNDAGRTVPKGPIQAKFEAERNQAFGEPKAVEQTRVETKPATVTSPVNIQEKVIADRAVFIKNKS